MREVVQECRSTGELVSLELDGELSELDGARLEAHLAACASCRALRSELGGMTSALRAAPLEPMSRPIALPHKVRVFVRPLQVGAAAAVVAVVAGLAGMLGTLNTSGPDHRVPSVESGEGVDALRDVRRTRLLHASHRTVPQTVHVGRAGGRPAV
jgi:predicted anti-sigma-YlaC factor YlaD